jgi:hypothetical protein
LFTNILAKLDQINPHPFIPAQDPSLRSGQALVGVPLRVCFAREVTEKQGIASADSLGSPCFSEGSFTRISEITIDNKSNKFDGIL